MHRSRPVRAVLGTWRPVTLDQDELLSFYLCSGHDVATADGRAADDDLTGVGCDGGRP